MIKPSRIINSIDGSPYLRRWHIIPRNRWLNIYLHHFVASDDDRALHCHPWASLSFLLKGELWEIYRCSTLVHGRPIRWLRPVVRPATHTHRLVLAPGKEAWTLFITGPRVREWGFYCPNGWKHQRPYHQDGGCD